jgi:hypothetical protein
MDIYECESCGITGEIDDIHHEDYGDILICRECNGDGELCLKNIIDKE